MIIIIRHSALSVLVYLWFWVLSRCGTRQIPLIVGDSIANIITPEPCTDLLTLKTAMIVTHASEIQLNSAKLL